MYVIFYSELSVFCIINKIYVMLVSSGLVASRRWCWVLVIVEQMKRGTNLWCKVILYFIQNVQTYEHQWDTLCFSPQLIWFRMHNHMQTDGRDRPEGNHLWAAHLAPYELTWDIFWYFQKVPYNTALSEYIDLNLILNYIRIETHWNSWRSVHKIPPVFVAS